MRIELLASLEGLLCFCHTGNTAVFATSLMHPLGLSKGALKDGFPMLLPLFEQPTIHSAMGHGYKIDPHKWPLKDQYSAIASRRAQVLTYSIRHFLVSSIFPYCDNVIGILVLCNSTSKLHGKLLCLSSAT